MSLEITSNLIGVGPTNTYFYLKVTDELAKECIKAKLFKLDQDKIIKYEGYIWSNTVSDWGPKNYAEGNVKLYKCANSQGELYKNMVWYSEEDYGKFSDHCLNECFAKKLLKAELEESEKLMAKVQRSAAKIKSLYQYIKE